jgi:hypothetical protein
MYFKYLLPKGRIYKNHFVPLLCNKRVLKQLKTEHILLTTSGTWLSQKLSEKDGYIKRFMKMQASKQLLIVRVVLILLKVMAR